MIGYLRGNVLYSEGNRVVVDVGGVGYVAHLTASALSLVGDEGSPVAIYTHTYVRDDIFALYGFSTRQEMAAFELLLSVSGVGPKVALAILSAMDAGSLAHAISVGDTRTLVKAPGLGPKTAQRLVLELRDKMAPLAVDFSRTPVGVPTARKPRTTMEQFETDLLEALVSLGYSRKDAERVSHQVADAADSSAMPTTATGLKTALNILTGN